MRVFHDSVYDTRETAPSHWAATVEVRPATLLAGRTDADVAIVGGGLTGLSTALHLARDHGIDPVVIDAAPIGWGASGRNGGFVTWAATKLGVAAMDRRYGRTETDRFFRGQIEAVGFVRDLLAREGIDAEVRGVASYEVAHHPRATADLAAFVRLCRDRFGLDAAFLDADAFAAEGHRGTEQFGAMRLAGPFALNPLRLVAGLREAAERHGARIHARSPAISWTRAGGRHVLRTPGGEVRARYVVLATNGYTPDDLSRRYANRALPALSNILVTRPLTADELAGAGWRTDCPVANTRELLFYYRLLPDDRFLFGARGGVSGGPDETAAMRAWLARRMGEVFPSFSGATVERFWSGLVCLTGRLTPAVDRLADDPSILHAFGWHGSGVNTAPWAGARIAAAIAAGDGTPPDVPAPMRGLPPSLVHPLVRRMALRSAYAWYAMRERVRERTWPGAR